MADPKVLKKKLIYPISGDLNKYLHHYDRHLQIPITYADLKHYISATPLFDKNGIDTLWESVFYSPSDMRELFPALTQIYALLKTKGDMSVMDHLRVDRIDYCTFGNTNPFRVRIVNDFNDNYDYYYVKVADASRVYGLELEHILSPNRINYFVHDKTLIEEHIAGIPGDVFITQFLKLPNVNEIRIAKEFIKFNERCLVRMLGDMRAYNFVIDITPDFDDIQYRIRAIDFDQQSYEGKINIYQPHYFGDNRAFVELGIRHLNNKTLKQYQQEERTLIAMRAKSSRNRLGNLMNCMSGDSISRTEKIIQLRSELAEHYGCDDFLSCNSMAEILKASLEYIKNN